MKRLFSLFSVLVFAGMLVACGGQKPETPEQRMFAAEVAYQGALETINRLIDAGVINEGNAAEVQAGRESARASLEAARRAFDAGLPTSTTLIGAANSAVLSLVNSLELLEGV